MSPAIPDAMHSDELRKDFSKIPCETYGQLSVNSPCSAKSKCYYWTNLAGVSSGVVCIMTGYNVLFYIQSSLHSKGGLGTMSLAVDYATQVISCFFLPPLLMRNIGCKWSLVFSGTTVVIYTVANLPGTFETLIPASVLMGIGYATLWATMNTVVSDLAAGYAALTGRSAAATMAQFFSIFFSVVSTASIWANIISSQLLSSQSVDDDYNSSSLNSACGAQYCDVDQTLPNNANSSLNITLPREVPQSEILNLVIAGVSNVGLGIILLVILLHTYQPGKRVDSESRLNVLLGTMKLLRDPNLLLLIIITINSGLMYSFITADFTKAFVTCSIGIHNVGLVVSAFGMTMTMGAVILVFVSQFLPRTAIFFGAADLDFAVLILMLFWTPDPQTPSLFYIISGVCGLTYAVWMPQLLALYGDVFPANNQEAYSNHRTWECVGFFIGFAWSHYLCMDVKIYIILGCLITGITGYFLVERRLSKNQLGVPMTH